MNTIKKIVIVGGGTAGWMSAALMKKMLAEQVSIELVESESIGTVGVGEATIPPIQVFNQALGIDEADFLRETHATLKLAIQFENWKVTGDRYLHTFGAAGQGSGFCPFHHYWLRAQALGIAGSLWDYDLNAMAAKQNKFAKLALNDPQLEMPYAYHFDATAYAMFLRKYSEALGVKRIEGTVTDVCMCQQTGDVRELKLADGTAITGELFIDCSGFRGLLIQQKLNVGYEDWRHWLPCDKALAVPSEAFAQTRPYTRSIAHQAGWQWQIPLQHRNGNGLVYSSAHLDDQKAADLLLENIESSALAEPKALNFRTGRARQQWSHNVVAIGLASGFLEPLESTSIHLIQSAIVRLIKLFPHHGIASSAVDEFNRQSQREYEQIRDFIILHYHQNQRQDSDFWRDLQRMPIPQSLAEKMQLFSETAAVFRDSDELFMESSWLQVMLGQGIMPKSYHPLAEQMSPVALSDMLVSVQEPKAQLLAGMPQHNAFIDMYTRRSNA